MAYILNAPADFSREALAGFAAAYADVVAHLDGGVLARTPSGNRRVGVVTGGGSGHYPAFAGFVGAGMADAAVAGNVFASPASDTIAHIARHAAGACGVLFCFGNYAGDVMQFGAAASLLEAEGIRCETVLVTDDISSAPPESAAQRRGVAGDLFVLKILGAAADRAMALNDLAEIGRRANAATTTLGVAFTGCTLPGDVTPLFEVAPRTMALGLGIHGEPGLTQGDILTADELADLMLERLLHERIEDRRAAVIINGLGAVKYEELFVLYGSVSKRLRDAGVEIVAPEVGEFVTSFEMAGASVTLAWLDEELESLWLAPVAAAGFRRSGRQFVSTASPETVVREIAPAAVPPASETSRRAARKIASGLSAVAQRLFDDAESLGALDAIAGDGDHGIGMKAGATAACDAVRELSEPGPGTVLRTAALAWNKAAGGTSGALWSVILSAFARELGDVEKPTAKQVVSGARLSLREVQAIGGAVPGDKTIVDALEPFTARLEREVDSGTPLPAAWVAAATAATSAAHHTADLVARRGRSRTHGRASLGTPDPGAVSFATVVTTFAEHFGKRGDDELRQQC